MAEGKIYWSCFYFSESKKCWTHNDCLSNLKCTNGYCGDPGYFKALQDRPCEHDEVCEVIQNMCQQISWPSFQQLLTGDMCCFDLSAADQWKSGQAGWKKKCCNNPSGSPVIRPHEEMEEWEIKKVDIWAVLTFYCGLKERSAYEENHFDKSLGS